MAEQASISAWRNPKFLNSYFGCVTISTDDVHYAYDYPGERSLRLLGDVSGKEALEIGCGRGENSIALAKMGARPTGIDISPEMLSRSAEKAENEGVHVHLVQMRAEDI